MFEAMIKECVKRSNPSILQEKETLVKRGHVFEAMIDKYKSYLCEGRKCILSKSVLNAATRRFCTRLMPTGRVAAQTGKQLVKYLHLLIPSGIKTAVIANATYLFRLNRVCWPHKNARESGYHKEPRHG